MALPRHRRSLRLQGYDYTWPGAYFVTVCTFERRSLFGPIHDGAMQLNELGKIVEQAWLQTGVLRSRVKLDVYAIMPNHIHGIIFIQGEMNGSSFLSASDKGRATGSPLRNPSLPAGSLGAMLAQFKSQATREAKAKGLLGQAPLWQRHYYEHIIRDEEDLNRIREYILNNPQRWSEDQENPDVFRKNNP